MSDLAYEVEVDRTSPAEWSAMLDQFQDANLYQTWEYGAVRWRAKNLSHLVVRRNGEVLGMAQLRIVRPTNFNFGMAYLRWGPICHRRIAELDPDFVRFMATALRTEYVGKRKLYLEILPNAFSGSFRGEIFQSAFAHFASKSSVGVNAYRTFVLDLSQPLEALRRKLNPKWRNKLNGAEKNNLKVIEGDGSEEYRTFCEIYAEMLTRKRFETSVNIEEFGRIQGLLKKGHRMRVLICQHEGRPVSAIVCSAMGDSAIYLLGATNDAGLTSKGAYLLQWEIIRWLKEKGIGNYDLGGIDPEANPGVHSFKSGLSGTDTCHISPFVACDNGFSAAAVKAGQILRNVQVRANSVFTGGNQ
jgi:lipid II:glycine glycyltransferase (peptidoglycan interpeptide bridge formation enzyme)